MPYRRIKGFFLVLIVMLLIARLFMMTYYAGWDAGYAASNAIWSPK